MFDHFRGGSRPARIMFWSGAALLAGSLIFAAVTHLQAVTPHDFSLPSPGGDMIRLADTRGKVVILNFWASWCVPCAEEMPKVESFYKAHQAEDIAVIGVNVGETPQVAGAFARQVGATFPIALDQDTAVATHYGMRGLPMTIIIDRSGLIHWSRLGQVTRALLEQNLPG